MENSLIKVLLADDHEMFMDGMASILEKQPEIQLVSKVASGKDALEYLKFNPVDVAILDIDMPEPNGIEATKIIKKSHPATKVLILTMFKQEQKLKQALAAGADGYVLKDSRKEVLLEAIRNIHAGKKHMDQGVMELLIPKSSSTSGHVPATLTEREAEILTLIAKGKQSKHIAEALFISPATVDTHTRNIKSKLNIDNRLELVIYAKENGYV
jgi:DNA-binding NarL/FixJ family response regulator